MSWIEVIDYKKANSKLKKIYDRVKGPDNNIDNVLAIHSLRPHSLKGHMTLYKNVLHNSNNTLPKWYLEAIGIYVSSLNDCDYCVKHHFEGFKRLLKDDVKANQFLAAAHNNSLSTFFQEKYLEGMHYSKKLTFEPSKITEHDIALLKEEGFVDGEILEINQVVSYFNYVNWTVLGLGVNTDGDVLGLSPSESDDPSNWSHN